MNTEHSKVWAEISVSAIRNNYRLVQSRLPHGTKQMCVVKANAYGHGADIVVKTLAEEGADFFAVSSAAEALSVRALTDADVLILGYVTPDEVVPLLQNNVSLAVYSGDYAAILSARIAAAKASGEISAAAKLRIHIKLDTGMNRLGFPPEETAAAAAVCGDPLFSPEGIFTHFATADEIGSPQTEKQYCRFKETVSTLEEMGIHFRIKHAANSAATFFYPAAHFDYVRSGIVLYGLNPSEEQKIEGLSPVLTLRTVVAHIHTLKKGESVSYGAEFTATEDMTVATLPIGYADGFLRAYKNGYVTIGGHRAPILGRICMDQCMADITDFAETVKIGDAVCVYGPGGAPIDHFAALAGTNVYEPTCILTPRVARVPIK